MILTKEILSSDQPTSGLETSSSLAGNNVRGLWAF